MALFSGLFSGEGGFLSGSKGEGGIAKGGDPGGMLSGTPEQGGILSGIGKNGGSLVAALIRAYLGGQLMGGAGNVLGGASGAELTNLGAAGTGAGGVPGGTFGGGNPSAWSQLSTAGANMLRTGDSSLGPWAEFRGGLEVGNPIAEGINQIRAGDFNFPRFLGSAVGRRLGTGSRIGATPFGQGNFEGLTAEQLQDLITRLLTRNDRRDELIGQLGAKGY